MTFDDFYGPYPRKAGRKPAKSVWDRLSEDDRIQAMQALPNHIAYWEAAGTEKQFIPHCSTWLNQERWTDEIEMPKPKTIEPAWWTNDVTVIAKGREIGCHSIPGETMGEYKARVIKTITNQKTQGYK